MKRKKTKDAQACNLSAEEAMQAYVEVFHQQHSPAFLIEHAERTARWVLEQGATWQEEGFDDPEQAKRDAEELLTKVRCARTNLNAGNYVMLGGWLYWIGRTYQRLRPKPFDDELKKDVSRGRKVKSSAALGGPTPMTEEEIRVRSNAWRPYAMEEKTSPKVKNWTAAGRAARAIQTAFGLDKCPSQRSVYDFVFAPEKLIARARQKKQRREAKLRRKK